MIRFLILTEKNRRIVTHSIIWTENPCDEKCIAILFRMTNENPKAIFYALHFYGECFFGNILWGIKRKMYWQNSLALHNECEYLWLSNTFGNLVCMARKRQIWILIDFEAFGKKIIVSKLFSYSWFKSISFGSVSDVFRRSFSLWRQWQSHKISECRCTCMQMANWKSLNIVRIDMDSGQWRMTANFCFSH